MYDPTLKPTPQRLKTGLRYRIESLLEITGIKMAKYRTSWVDAQFRVAWRPHVLLFLFLEVKNQLLFSYILPISLAYMH